LQLHIHTPPLSQVELLPNIITRSSAAAEIARDADDVETAIQSHSRSSVVLLIDAAWLPISTQ